VHAAGVPAVEPADPLNEEAREIEDYLRRLKPRVASFLKGIELAPLPMPALLDFGFYSPRGTILISHEAPERDISFLAGHLFVHLAQQVRRFRQRNCRGFLLLSSPAWRRFAESMWPDLLEARDRDDLRLAPGSRDLLCANACSCPTCHCPPNRLAWVYFVAPGPAWLVRAGLAGWTAVCDSCQIPVGIFVDRQN
jgi:hypothetical protein